MNEWRNCCIISFPRPYFRFGMAVVLPYFFSYHAYWYCYYSVIVIFVIIIVITINTITPIITALFFDSPGYNSLLRLARRLRQRLTLAAAAVAAAARAPRRTWTRGRLPRRKTPPSWARRGGGAASGTTPRTQTAPPAAPTPPTRSDPTPTSPPTSRGRTRETWTRAGHAGRVMADMHGIIYG